MQHDVIKHVHMRLEARRRPAVNDYVPRWYMTYIWVDSSVAISTVIATTFNMGNTVAFKLGSAVSDSMANAVHNLFASRRKLRILMVGLDAAGKTTVLYNLKMGDIGTTLPTIGFNAERIKHKNNTFYMWDVGGQDKIRPLWKFYFSGTQGLIFVIDSSDRARISEAKEELMGLLCQNELADAVLLILANKQDLPDAMDVGEMTEKLGLPCLRHRHRNWHVQPTCAITGDGLIEGLDWLSGQFNQPFNSMRRSKKWSSLPSSWFHHLHPPSLPSTPPSPWRAQHYWLYHHSYSSCAG